jgi:eukaryotic-like serine/threonine-protein kinase
MISMAQAPERVAKYDVKEEIGSGGMATVFRAYDPRLDRDVALKLIHRHLRQSTEVAARFNSEARVVAKLRHPNVVEVYDVSGEDDEAQYLVVELVRGPTLRALLTRHKVLPVELAAEIVLELAGALEHAHSLNVIHRDIKPENVLIDAPREGVVPNDDDLSRPRVKLTDFGIAKLLDAQGVTSTGQVLGSPAHMAPEQIEGKPVDVRADVFSLGVLFYEAIVGSLPFAGRNPAQVLRNVLEGNFQPPERVRPEIGSRWSAIVTKALARDPDGRFNSIVDFAAAVREELKRVEFQDCRADITRFLADPVPYVEEFQERIVRGLSRSGRRARANRDRVLATAQFSRALAYKPGDSALLRQVSGLRRDETLKRVLRIAAVTLLVLGGIAGAIVLWPEDVQLPDPAPKQARTSRVPDPVARQVPETAPTSKLAVSPKEAEPKRTPRKTAADPEPEVRPGEVRTVSVKLAGVLGGTLRIDGEPRPWFGVTHELTVGEHTFEFIPPNDNCCEQVKQTLLVKPGEGVQEIRGRIPFKDATLKAQGAEIQGLRLSCPAVFAGSMALPGERSVPMTEETWSGICTLSGFQEGSERRQKSITLRAGDTTVLTLP